MYNFMKADLSEQWTLIGTCNIAPSSSDVRHIKIFAQPISESLSDGNGKFMDATGNRSSPDTSYNIIKKRPRKLCLTENKKALCQQQQRQCHNTIQKILFASAF